MMELGTALLQSCVLIIAVSEVILADRRRVSFLNCPSTNTNIDVVTIKPAASTIECSVICLNDPDCLSASYCQTIDGFTCQLSRFYTEGSCAGLVADGDCSHTAMLNPCENGATFFPQNRTCHCADGFGGHYCQRRYRDCQETPPKSPLYLIQPYGSDHIFEYRCWSTTYTRVTEFVSNNNKANFTRSWQQMKKGTPVQTLFLFIGLDQLTKQGMYNLSLWIISTTNSGFLWYTNFHVDSEADGYAWHWDSFERDTRARYHSDEYLDGLGGAGDDSKNLNGARFGTFDNDVNGCARTRNAAMWYNPNGCTTLKITPEEFSWPTNRSGTAKIEKYQLQFSTYGRDSGTSKMTLFCDVNMCVCSNRSCTHLPPYDCF